MDYGEYNSLKFARSESGVLTIVISRPEALNATDARMHWELSQIWKTVTHDSDTKVVLITGEGRAFSAGGDFEMLDEIPRTPESLYRVMQEARDIVYGMTQLDKPIVSAINGVAVGAGLAVALMADISIISEEAKITDGHTRLGLVAGDHAAIIWPLLCGLAKAKYYLLLGDFIDGREAERIGLVSKVVPAKDLMSTAQIIANRLASGSQPAIRFTKRTLNQWVMQAGPIFDASLALEFLTFIGPDMREGLAALKERREPKFELP